MLVLALALLVVLPIFLVFNPNGCRLGKFLVVAQIKDLGNPRGIGQRFQHFTLKAHGFKVGSTEYVRGPQNGIPSGAYLLVVWRYLLVFQWFDISTAKQVRVAPR